MTSFTPATDGQRKALLRLHGAYEDSSGSIFVTAATVGRANAIVNPEDASSRQCWRDRKRALYRALDRLTPRSPAR